MVDITLVKSRPTPHQNTHLTALQTGFQKLGINAPIVLKNRRIKTKLCACWGWRLGKRLMQAGHKVLVLERGYIGDRFSYTSLGWNGLNGYASFPIYQSANQDRFTKVGGVIRPWKTDGDEILILGQVPTDASLKGLNLFPKYAEWANKAKEAYGKKVVFRPHPDVVKRGQVKEVPGVPLSEGSLEDAFSRAFLCITFNSNSSVDAVLAGVPTITMDRGSMAWEVTSHSFIELRRPDREKWAYNLAHTQWTIPEIESGEPLKAVMGCIP